MVASSRLRQTTFWPDGQWDEDYYKRIFRPDAPDRHCLVLSRVLIVVWAVVIAVVAVVLSGRETIIGMVYSISAPFFGCAVGIFLLGTATRRATSWGVFCGALLGYGFVLWARFCVFQVDGTWHLTPWSLDASATAVAKPVSPFWLPFISFLGTVIPGYLISLLFPRPSATNLRGLTVWGADSS